MLLILFPVTGSCEKIRGHSKMKQLNKKENKRTSKSGMELHHVLCAPAASFHERLMLRGQDEVFI